MVIPFRIPPDTARGYGGAAHRITWPVSRVAAAPSSVELDTETYRLVLRPRSGRPALDHVGNYVYVPARRPA